MKFEFPETSLVGMTCLPPCAEMYLSQMALVLPREDGEASGEEAKRED